MKKMYDGLKERMNQINFDAIWPGFKQYDFALYDGKSVYTNGTYKDWDSRYFGCTAINIEGKLLAIWDVRMIPERYDLDFLCTNIIHEMFHCFQVEKYEQKFPNEIMGMNYPIVLENQVLKYVETSYLYQAYTEEQFLKRQELLNQFLNCRIKREEILGEYIQYEYQLESVEGLAMYVEMKALSQLTNFSVSFNHYCRGYKDINQKLLNIRHNSFIPGMIMGLFLDELYTNWKKDFIIQENFSFDILRDLLEINCIEIVMDKEIETKIQNLIQLRKQKIGACFNSILKVEHHTLMGDFTLSGFDPMNLFKSGKFIYHKHMLRFTEDGEEKYIEGPLVSVHDPKNVFTVFEIHYKKN